MKVTPISAATAAAQANPFLWQRCICDFEVLEAYEKVSKSGNDMIELLVRVTNPDGKTQKLKDWLVEADATAYKVRHFAEAIGMLKQYEAGELKADDVIDKTGRCQIGIQKDKEEKYPDRNKVTDYLPPLKPGAQPLVASIPDDEIPF